MALLLSCSTKVFERLLDGFEDVTVQCQNCGHWSAKVYRRWEWLTVCWLPVVPFSVRPWHEVGCSICHFYQDLQYRPDAQNAPKLVPLRPFQRDPAATASSSSQPDTPTVPTLATGHEQNVTEDITEYK